MGRCAAQSTVALAELKSSWAEWKIDMADQYNGGPAIAAISTPAGTGAIAIIRISGRESIEIVDAVFQPADKSSLRDSPSHTIHYGCGSLDHADTGFGG
ncbi:MAG: hypothetical protein ACLR23_26435 [Clostridia bacterium]